MKNMHFCCHHQDVCRSLCWIFLHSSVTSMDTYYVHFIITYNDCFLPSSLSMCLHKCATREFLFINACHVLFKSKKLTVIASFVVESNEHFLRLSRYMEKYFPFSHLLRCWMLCGDKNGKKGKIPRVDRRYKILSYVV